ncbi:hypothetical protein CRX42_00510 [Pseudomonas jessenii]|uniref:Uncharacterized protein n=1 Tax=Pseudomonas jessenii TaxID=77298 RepID=A0A2W0EVY0_PSEJE|nr:hypothetical protein CRX42_00510 [Pseudomonas jessenii]
MIDCCFEEWAAGITQRTQEDNVSWRCAIIPFDILISRTHKLYMLVISVSLFVPCWEFIKH